jgi:hypothetical protein
MTMDGLLTAAERMDTSYLWRARKSGQRVHIENPETARAYCQVENCRHGEPLDGRGAEVPTGRRLCGNCVDLAGRDKADYREPSLAVLMGERFAEDEPGLFASLVAPERERTDLISSGRQSKWKRGKQVRRVHRSKGRKPKRSTVKYPRPFNDDLPW